MIDNARDNAQISATFVEMARRKQSIPKRARENFADQVFEGDGAQRRKRTRITSVDVESWTELAISELDDGKEVAEISIFSCSYSTEPVDKADSSACEGGSSLTVKLQVANLGRATVGGIQELTRQDVVVQISGYIHSTSDCNQETLSMEVPGCANGCRASGFGQVFLSGEIDVSNSVLSALVHLIRMRFVGLRPIPCSTCFSVKCLNHKPLGRLRVVITNKAFEVFKGAHTTRLVLRKAMQSVMCWLRPELSHLPPLGNTNVSSNHKVQTDSIEKDLPQKVEKCSVREMLFDPSRLYETVKPTQTEPCLNLNLPQFLPDLRPYQGRAASWMIQRECEFVLNDSSVPNCGTSSLYGSSRCNSKSHPLWFAVHPVDGTSDFYYNPYSGGVSFEPHEFVSYVHGGILADEMGLGKTVELLACIFANPYKVSSLPTSAQKAAAKLKGLLEQRKHERVECTCGAVEEDDTRQEHWVQCDCCDAWQHTSCVGYSSFCKANMESKHRKPRSSAVNRQQKLSQILVGADLPGKSRETYCPLNAIERGTEFVCGLCAELIGGAEVEGDCGATLVVCPTSILRQWQCEIARHTKLGSLRVIIYDGVQNGGTIVMDRDAVEGTKKLKLVSAHDLAAADIVLTTYDILRTDLSHDSDRIQSNQRSLRFQKRFPIVPTPLTRLRWWRICLDEAQMVESSTAQATEMAMLLSGQNLWCISGTPIQRGLDDLYGLLKFLRAEPFDDYYYWTTVLKQPYENGKMEPLHEFLNGLMWRSSKAQVMDELNLPVQGEQLSWLRFSAIEAHFYRQQHDKCAVKAREVLAKYSQQSVCNEKATVLSCTRSIVADNCGGPSAPANEGADHVGIWISEDAVLKRTGFAVDNAVGNSSISIGDPDRPLANAETSVLLNSLLKLRQACCHPQVGSSGIRSLQRSPMTMNEILQVLIDKAKLEAEESQRVLLGALNGLAALAVIEQDIRLAVSTYREALAHTEENASDFSVDPLQKLHTLHNLADIMKISESCETTINARSESMAADCDRSKEMYPKTLRDDHLVEQCLDIQSHYMSLFKKKHEQALADFESAHTQVLEARKDSLKAGGPNWWLDVLAKIEQSDRQLELVGKIRYQLLETDHLGRGRQHRNASSLALRFQDFAGLKYVVQRELDALDNMQNQMVTKLSQLNELMKSPTAHDAERLVNCSRHSNMNGPVCTHCEMDDIFQTFENRLFLLRTSAADADGVVSAEDAVIAQQRNLAHKRISGEKSNDLVDINEVQGRIKRSRERFGATEAEVTKAPSETEKILVFIKAQAKAFDGKAGQAAAAKHLQIFEAMKKEYAQARALTLAQREMLYALDELNMAKTRLQLCFPGEKIDKGIDGLFKLHPEEVPQRNVLLTVEKFEALKDFSRAKGQLRYLKGLSVISSGCQLPSNTGNLFIGNPMEDCCPVCHDKLGTQLMVLPCGHLLCCKCLMSIVERAPTPSGGISQKRILCPSCRQRTNVWDIAFVDNELNKNTVTSQIGQLQGVEASDEASIQVEGSYGTKIEAVVRRILCVTLKDPSAKLLIFSTWQDVLDVVEHALRANSITFARAKGRRLDSALQRFQGKNFITPNKMDEDEVEDERERVQVLLLTIQQGGNGLNLVEAQHVILVEPLPNPAAEAQAINRIHRIGQNRPTFVHRFVVCDSVEESIYWLGKHKTKTTGRFDNSGIGSKKKDRFSFTVSEVNALFGSETQPAHVLQSHSLRHLPPSVAAAVAAESRLQSSYALKNANL